jgi:FkbM family methyltransferase
MYEELPKTIDQFLEQVTANTLAAIKINRFIDNYDPVRTLIDGSDGSGVFESGRHAFFFRWFFENIFKLFEAYNIFEDDSSKRLYLYLISFRMGGHLSVRLPVEFSADDISAFELIEGNKASSYELNTGLGGLKRVDFEYEGQSYRGDFYGLEYYLVRRQYFYTSPHANVCPEEGDVVIDGGACTGDSALVFSNAVGATGRVIAFDPVAEHCSLIKHNVAEFPYQNVTVVPAGLSNRTVMAPPISINRCAPGFRVSSPEVPIRSLDSMVMAGDMDRVDFIKMDIEGSEIDALNGAVGTISRFKPKLAISLYHNPNDLFAIPLMVKEMCPTYRFFLGHYTIHYDETVLYGRPS